MRRLALIVLLLVAPTLTSACHAPVTVTTPQGQIAYTADQVAVRVNELQNAAIAANAQGQLSTVVTQQIVTFCVGADKTLGATPAGWPAAVRTAWDSTKAALPPITNPAVAAAISAVDLVLGGLAR